jgi:hypothetical protein
VPRISLLQVRAGTASAWTSANPTLAAGEPGLETDTRKIKYGDGSTAWNSLAYSAAGTADVASKASKVTASGLDRTVFVTPTTPTGAVTGDIWIQA